MKKKDEKKVELNLDDLLTEIAKELKVESTGVCQSTETAATNHYPTGDSVPWCSCGCCSQNYNPTWWCSTCRCPSPTEP